MHNNNCSEHIYKGSQLHEALWMSKYNEDCPDSHPLTTNDVSGMFFK